MGTLKPASVSNAGAQAAIESALRALEAEASGIVALTAALRDSVADVREQAAFAIGQISGQQ